MNTTAQLVRDRVTLVAGEPVPVPENATTMPTSIVVPPLSASGKLPQLSPDLSDDRGNWPTSTHGSRRFDRVAARWWEFLESQGWANPAFLPNSVTTFGDLRSPG